MAKKSIFSKLLPSDTKARGLVILSLAVVLSIGGYFYMRRGAKQAAIPSSAAPVPGSIQNIPGGALTPEYRQTLIKANIENLKAAQMAGKSSVATLIGTGDDTTDFTTPQACSAATCCNCDDIDAADKIQQLLSTGKIQPEVADELLKLNQDNVPVSEYAAALDRLVKEGKLTPEQARQLLDDYKKSHANKTAQTGAKLMDQLIKAGTLPVDAANALLDAQKKNLPVATYAAEVSRLVGDGKISPKVGQQLLAAYKTQHDKNAARAASAGLNQLVKSGTLTQPDAQSLQAMQDRDVPVADYAAQLARLVKEGKISPETAQRLLSQYKTLHPEAVDQAKATLAGLAQKGQSQLLDWVKQGKISSGVASTLSNVQSQNPTPQAYADQLDRLVKNGQLSPDMRDQLLTQYKALDNQRKQAAQTIQHGGTVAAGQAITADAQGLQAIQAADTAAPAVSAAPDAAAVSAAPDATATPTGFAQLQQRMAAASAQQQQAQAAQPAVVQTAQQQQQALQEQKQKFLLMQTAMKTQAQQIFTSWNTIPDQENLPAVLDEEMAAAQGQSGQADQGAAQKSSSKAPFIRAGDIVYAVLDTEANSDYPTSTVMATIVQGPLKGGKLLGGLTTGRYDNKRLILNFTLLSSALWNTSKSIDAVAIDPNTASQAMATSVNNHYLVRYGALFASSFLEGYSDAVTQAGTSTISASGDSVQVTQAPVSARGRIMVGLGQVGENFADEAQELFDRPPTVKVAAGIGVGILFLQDVDQSGPVNLPSDQADKGQAKQNSSSSAAASTNDSKPAVAQVAAAKASAESNKSVAQVAQNTK